MKAIVYEEYGPPEVLELKEVPKPTPKHKEVLIRIQAATVSAEDPKMRDMRKRNTSPLFWLIGRLVVGFSRPRRKTLGIEFAGEIEATGEDVKLYKSGDQVYGYTGIGFGAHAEYLCLPENGVLAIKPANVTYKEAATIPNGTLTALIFLRDKGRIEKGQRVLIYGASGSVGTAAVQLARHYGAEVTGVCSGANAELVRSLGADKVLDYNKDDFTKSGERYDIVFDTIGKTTFARCKGSLTSKGRYLRTEFGLHELLEMAWTALFGSQKAICAASNLSWNSEELAFVRQLIETGRLRPVVDRCYPFEQMVEAHRYVEKGHKKGNVVVTVGTELPKD